MEIRELQPGDFPQFSQIMKKFYHHAGNSIPKEDGMKILFDKALDRESNLVFIAALDNQELVGILSLTFGESSYKVSSFAWGDDLYVNENYRNKGVGKKLIQKAKEIAESRNCSNILVGVGQDEIEVQKFCQSLGFMDLKCKLLSLPIAKK